MVPWTYPPPGGQLAVDSAVTSEEIQKSSERCFDEFSDILSEKSESSDPPIPTGMMGIDVSGEIFTNISSIQNPYPTKGGFVKSEKLKYPVRHGRGPPPREVSAAQNRSQEEPQVPTNEDSCPNLPSSRPKGKEKRKFEELDENEDEILNFIGNFECSQTIPPLGQGLVKLEPPVVLASQREPKALLKVCQFQRESLLG